jgi:hypothetical protein
MFLLFCKEFSYTISSELNKLPYVQRFLPTLLIKQIEILNKHNHNEQSILHRDQSTYDESNKKFVNIQENFVYTCDYDKFKWSKYNFDNVAKDKYEKITNFNKFYRYSVNYLTAHDHIYFEDYIILIFVLFISCGFLTVLKNLNTALNNSAKKLEENFEILRYILGFRYIFIYSILFLYLAFVIARYNDIYRAISNLKHKTSTSSIALIK